MVSGVSTLSTPGAASAAVVSIERDLARCNRAFDQHAIGEAFELLLDRVSCRAGDLGRAVDARQPPADLIARRRPKRRRAVSWGREWSCHGSRLEDGAGDDARRQFDLVVVGAMVDGALDGEQAGGPHGVFAPAPCPSAPLRRHAPATAWSRRRRARRAGREWCGRRLRSRCRPRHLPRRTHRTAGREFSDRSNAWRRLKPGC